jgi:hypothetical protein
MSFTRALPAASSAVALVLAAVASSSPARGASPDNRAAARQHLSQAEESKKQGRLVEACAHLQEVARLEPKLPILLDLAECYEQVGNLVQAEVQWAAARDRAKRDEKPQSRARAEARLAAVQKRVAHLTLQLAPNAPAGTQVLRDDESLNPASFGSSVVTNPGAHVILVKAPGHQDAKYEVQLADGDNQTLALKVGGATTAATASARAPSSAALPSVATAAPSVVPGPAKPAAPTSASWWSSERTAGVVLGAGGLIAVAGGSVLVAGRDSTTVDPRLALGGISIATGGVLLVSGLVLLATSPKADAAQQARQFLSPTLVVSRSAAVLGAAGEF